MEIFEKELEELLIHKTFEKLTDVEKKYVLQHIIKEEYQSYHLLLSRATSSFTEKSVIMPDANIKLNLKNTFRASQKNQLSDYQFFNLPFFSYKSVLQGAFLLVVFISVVWLFFNVNKELKPVNIVKSKVEHSKINDSNKFNNAQQTTIINATTHLLSRNLNMKVNIPERKRNIKFHKAFAQILNIENEEPLCLKVKVEPIGLNLNINESTILCLTTYTPQRDSSISEIH